MKDAIIVRKVTAYLVMKGRIGEKKNEETSGIIFNHPVTDSRDWFSWRKNHDP